MRKKLIIARKHGQYKQSDIAKILNISIRHYQRIEAGNCGTSNNNWDALEDLFNVDQRDLRTITDDK